MENSLQPMLGKLIDFLTSVQSYLTPFGAMTLIMFLVMLLAVVNVYGAEKNKKNASKKVLAGQDIDAIAGDDIMTTQLDLARAYIEMGEKDLAKKILQQVIKKGNLDQKHEAHRLMASC